MSVERKHRWLIVWRVLQAGLVLYVMIGIALTSVQFSREGCAGGLFECAGLFTAGVFLWGLWVGR